MKIGGVVLAGGLSRRMEGREKSLMPINGKSSLERVVARFAPQVEKLAINANGDASRFSSLGLPVIPDCVTGNVGPLAGILTGMRWAKDEGFSHVATAATDTPFFPLDYVGRLNAFLSSKDIAMAYSNGRIHPVFAIWPVSLANDLYSFLVDEDQRKILVFTNPYTVAEIDFTPSDEAKDDDPFFNINTPEDLRIAESRAGAIA